MTAKCSSSPPGLVLVHLIMAKSSRANSSSGPLMMSGLARPVTFGVIGVRQAARAEFFDKAIELLFVFKRRLEMSVDLLMSSHFLAVECHDIFVPGAEDGSLGNLIGSLLFFGINF
jgi:hypothetical protein